MTTASAAMLAICVAGAGIVFCAMLYSILKFWRTEGIEHSARNAKEFAWALVPIVIVIAAAIPSLQKHASASDTQFTQRATGDVTTGLPSLAANSELEVRVSAAHR